MFAPCSVKGVYFVIHTDATSYSDNFIEKVLFLEVSM